MNSLKHLLSNDFLDLLLSHTKYSTALAKPLRVRHLSSSWRMARPRHNVGPHKLLTDRLLNKCQEKEQTNCDVQIGDGMDIVIVGENGEIDIFV